MVLEEDIAAMAYEDRLAVLIARGVGLWDVIQEAERQGSLDAAIRDHAANDLASLIAALPALRAVAFNGATATRIGKKILGDVGGIDLIALPSSSPAYTLSFADKAQAWAALKACLTTDA